MRRRVLTVGLPALFFAGLAACGDPAMDMPMPEPRGTAQLTFQLTKTVRAGADPTGMTPLKGTVYGDIFLSEDVTLTGPIDGAMYFGGVELPLDLTHMMVSTQRFTTPPLAPNRYTFLGFLDLGDKTMPGKREPLPGHPVTLALTNKFDIEADKQIDYTVTFDLLLN